MKTFLITFLLIPVSALFSQTDSTYQINEILNSILEESTIDAEDSQLYDLIEELLNNPIDLNSASVNDLLKIPTIDLQTTQSIIDYRNKSGSFSSVNQLYLIENLNKESVDKIIPFITVSKVRREEFPEEKVITIPFSINYRSRLIEDIQDRKGFITNAYAGDKLKFYNRIKGEYSNYNFGLLTEKDAGEKSYADFYSFNFSADKFCFFDKIILGDYLVEFGQGLALWGPYSFSKGSEAVSSVSRNGRGIIPYLSSDENQFFRGGAAKINYNNFDFTFFYSANNFAATIENKFITSKPIDGYHRTENELSKKDAGSEKVLGTIIIYSLFQNSQINFLYYNSKFSASFLPDRIYDLSGSNFNFYSLSYSTIFDKFYLSGEFAFNGKSVASINNLQLTINRTFSFVASIRNYPRNFYSIHSSGFGESSNTQNEFGIYTGIKTKLKSTEINFYYDQFKFPFATSTLPLPSSGHEFLLDVFHSFTAKTKLRLRYSRENKEIKSEAVIDEFVGNQIRQKIRLELIYNVSKNIRLKSRIEFTDVSFNRSYNSDTGFLAFQDLRFSPYNNLNIYTRLIFFDTESFDSRVYEFENDLTGVLTNSPLSGKGTKWYFLINYEILKSVKISAKYSELHQPELSFLSSGLNEIAGNINSKFSLQIDCNF
ncbi:MAG: hypothetical protein A2068_04840 [Ignavibacteria bacterium GWB2_35_6b]|nr:MAG: hypothetical protein A2068_04840 [Ignavibacteria bacterium GWB2_35_6b]